MIKKVYRIKALIAVCIALVWMLLLSVTVKAAAALPEKNTELRHQVCTALSDSAKAYYQGEYRYGNLLTLSGAQDVSTSLNAIKDNELYSALHNLMSETHTFYTSYSGYKAGSLAYYWARTDAAENSSSYMMFYSDIPSGTGVTLNREHIWSKSRASFYQTNGGSDLHHLRPSVASLNMAKSDHAFGNIKNTSITDYTEGYIDEEPLYYVSRSEDLFECKDDVKGDVARILLYVYCRWEQPNLYTNLTEELPELDPDDTQDSGKKVIESLDTLLSWCAQDPVDTWEMKRNDLTQQVQGNRNVFIDYPELAWQLFSEEVPSDMATPSHPEGSQEGSTEIVEVLLGDADADGKVTVLDATIIQKKLASITVSGFDSIAADADQDGAITVLDATSIQKRLANLPSNPNIETLVYIS